MNAVIDEDLPRSFGLVLENLGFTVFDIRDHGLPGATDDQVFKFAQRHRAVLFSADLGFSNQLSFPLGTHFGICILRFPNQMSVNTTNQQVSNLLLKLSPADYKDNLAIVSPGKVRLRRYSGSQPE